MTIYPGYEKEIIGIGKWKDGKLFIVFKFCGNTICWTPPDWQKLTLVEILNAFASLSPNESIVQEDAP